MESERSSRSRLRRRRSRARFERCSREGALANWTTRRRVCISRCGSFRSRSCDRHERAAIAEREARLRRRGRRARCQPPAISAFSSSARRAARAAARADRCRASRTGTGTTCRRPSAGCDRSCRQNGSVVDEMMPNIVPSGSAKRSAGADDPGSTIGSIGAVARAPARRASPAARRRGRATSGVAPPTSMYSMNRTSRVHRPAVLDQVDQLVVVDAADDDGVDLELAEHAARRGDARRGRASSSSKRVSAAKRSRCSVSRLTVMRPRPAALQRVDLIGEQHAVGGQREIAQARLRGEHARRAPAGRGGAAARRRSAGSCRRRARGRRRRARSISSKCSTSSRGSQT